MKAKHFIALILVAASTNVFTLSFVILPMFTGFPLTGFPSPESKVQVVAGLSPNDVEEIKAKSSHYNTRWPIKHLRLESIQLLTNGTIEVLFFAKKSSQCGNILERRADGWRITTELFSPLGGPG